MIIISADGKIFVSKTAHINNKCLLAMVNLKVFVQSTYPVFEAPRNTTAPLFAIKAVCQHPAPS